MNGINNYAKKIGYVFNPVKKDYVYYGPTWWRKSISEMKALYLEDLHRIPEPKLSF